MRCSFIWVTILTCFGLTTVLAKAEFAGIYEGSFEYRFGGEIFTGEFLAVIREDGSVRSWTVEEGDSEDENIDDENVIVTPISFALQPDGTFTNINFGDFRVSGSVSDQVLSGAGSGLGELAGIPLSFAGTLQSGITGSSHFAGYYTGSGTSEDILTGEMFGFSLEVLVAPNGLVWYASSGGSDVSVGSGAINDDGDFTVSGVNTEIAGSISPVTFSGTASGSFVGDGDTGTVTVARQDDFLAGSQVPSFETFAFNVNALDSENMVVISVDVAERESAVLEGRPLLNEGDWTELVVVRGRGAVETISYPLSGTSSQFFRVVKRR